MVMFSYSEVMVIWQSECCNTMRGGDIMTSYAIKLYPESSVKRDDLGWQRVLLLSCPDKHAPPRCYRGTGGHWPQFQCCLLALQCRCHCMCAALVQQIPLNKLQSETAWQSFTECAHQSGINVILCSKPALSVSIYTRRTDHKKSPRVSISYS